MEIELKRDIYEELLQWKRRNSGLVLELEGARQVGKTVFNIKLIFWINLQESSISSIFILI